MSRLRNQLHPEPQPQQDQHRADPDHRVERPVQHRVRGRPVVGRHGVEPGHLGVGAPPDQERVEARDADAALHPFRCAAPVDVLRHVGVRLLHALHRGELDRLVVGDRARRGVAHRELDRRRDRRHRQRDQEAEAMVAVAPPAQHPHRVHRGDEEACNQVGRQDHVRNLVRHRRVEDHLHRIDVRDLAGRVERVALRLVHPRVHGDHREGAAEPGDHDRHAGPEMRPAGQALPAEDVDRDEDRLEEEEDALDREQDAEHVAEATGELRPQQAELEREHRARDRAHREGHGGHLRPPLREPQRDGVVLAQAAVVRDQHQRREGDAERRQDDVEPQRERHLGPRLPELRGERDAQVHRLRGGLAASAARPSGPRSSRSAAASVRSSTCGPRMREMFADAQSTRRASAHGPPVISSDVDAEPGREREQAVHLAPLRPDRSDRRAAADHRHDALVLVVERLARPAARSPPAGCARPICRSAAPRSRAVAAARRPGPGCWRSRPSA